jgi:hypothetical protein
VSDFGDPPQRCLPCPIGKFAGGGGQSVCTDCNSTAFAGVEGAVQCMSCPPNSRVRIANARVVTDCLCVAGFYGPAGGPCAPCPEGASCLGLTVDPPRALPGYWVDAENDPTTFYRCSPAEACVGFTAISNATCGVGYTGRICASCTPLHYYRLSGACAPCPNLAWLMWLAMAGAMFGATGLMVAISQPRDMKLYAPSIAITFVQVRRTPPLSAFAGVPAGWGCGGMLRPSTPPPHRPAPPRSCCPCSTGSACRGRPWCEARTAWPAAPT